MQAIYQPCLYNCFSISFFYFFGFTKTAHIQVKTWLPFWVDTQHSQFQFAISSRVSILEFHIRQYLLCIIIIFNLKLLPLEVKATQLCHRRSLIPWNPRLFLTNAPVWLKFCKIIKKKKCIKRSLQKWNIYVLFTNSSPDKQTHTLPLSLSPPPPSFGYAICIHINLKILV